MIIIIIKTYNILSDKFSNIMIKIKKFEFLYYFSLIIRMYINDNNVLLYMNNNKNLMFMRFCMTTKEKKNKN